MAISGRLTEISNFRHALQYIEENNANYPITVSAIYGGTYEDAQNQGELLEAIERQRQNSPNKKVQISWS